MGDCIYMPEQLNAGNAMVAKSVAVLKAGEWVDDVTRLTSEWLG